MTIARTLVAAAFAAATLATLPACTSDGTQRSVGQTTDDAVLLARVKTAMAKAPDVDAHEVNVDVRNGVVQLQGKVDTAAEARAAESVARSVSGVKSVQNDLRVGQ